MKRILALLAVAALATAPARAEPGLIQFGIEDQRGAKHTRSRFEGTALLLLWGDRQGTGFMARWSPALTDSLRAAIDSGNLGRLDVAHTRGAPFFVKGRIKGRFRRDWPQPVLLDWKGRFRQAYGCSSDSCSVLLFDARGRLSRHWTVAGPDSCTSNGIVEAARRAASVPR